MANISFKLDDVKINELINKYKDYLLDSKNEYIKAFIKTIDGTTISIYTTNKILIQGENAHLYCADILEEKYAQAGSDEVGTGDFFGPVCVCACIVEKEDYEFLEKLNITDSKLLSDSKILEIGKVLYERLKNSLLILNNKQYNEVHKTNNLNQIKAKMHNQAYINLMHKGYDIPKACYVDQFESEDNYYRHLINEKEVFHGLTFETKAETKYISVAAASIIARYAYLKAMEEMSHKYDFNFPKGAGDIVDKSAYDFFRKYGIDKLNEVSKTHFKNTQRVLDMLNKH